MLVGAHAQPSKKQRRVKLITGERSDWTASIQGAIARRAFEIFENRGRIAGHECEDWRLAESEVLAPLVFGVLHVDDKIMISSCLGCFERGEVEIGIEPRRIILRGRAASPRLETDKEALCTEQPGSVIYRMLMLPVEVDPTSSKVRVDGSILELTLLKRGGSARGDSQLKAA